mgnify:CR=1 FL=1
MKTTNEYLTKIRQFKQQFAEKYGIISIGIFGSVARGEQHEESDLDVFVELKDPDPFIMFDIMSSLILPDFEERAKLKKNWNVYVTAK